VGVDPSEKNIKTASVHAGEMGLEIDYRVGLAEDLAAAGERFDVILNMEVIEHVSDPRAYTRHLRLDAEAGRPDVRRHPQPHRSSPSHSPSSVRNMCWAGCPRARTSGRSSSRPMKLKGWLGDNGLT
jgi:hypothetical protein